MGVQRRVDPSPGRLVLFPSWLVHRVEPCPDGDDGLDETEAPRVSVSFNLVFAPSQDPVRAPADSP